MIFFIGYSQNYLDNETEWSLISGTWIWNISNDVPNSITNIYQQLGAVTWIGDVNKESLNWNNYSINANIQVLNCQNTGNAGILFYAQSVSSKNNGGLQYYLGVSGNKYISLGKMNNGYKEYVYQKIINVNVDPYLSFNLSATISYNNIIVSINNVKQFMFTVDIHDYISHGSIGLRGYLCEMLYNKIFVRFA